ncbi:MAG: hypothetical protein JXM70_12530, partial [Pirellulales bacterium]|nr:hypothetical protein [Pirellulales bacterium]
MKNLFLTALIATLIAPAALGSLGPVTPAVIYDDGTGTVPNGNWIVMSYPTQGIELALRAKERGTNVINVDSNGYYHYMAGSSGEFALWDFEFAANLGSYNLQNIRIDLWIDIDPTSGVNYLALE